VQIASLMQVPKPGRDVVWLRESLQAGIELELSTIPLYLCAMWSIKTQSGDVYDQIKKVVFQEMFHLGLVCNLLTTIGGTPRLASPSSVPKYPGSLPGGVRPTLNVYLSGLTRQVVKEVFMEIEYPQAGPIAFALTTTYPTIGDFYDAVSDAFVTNAASITGANQLTASNSLLGSLTAITTPDQVRRAIGMIKEQGEGTTQSPEATDFGSELAHYYRFAEIYHGKKLIKMATGDWKYEGDDVPFPEVYPVARVPAGGYPDIPAAVAFDKLFTKLLHQLELAWANGDQDQLDDAMLLKMRELTGLARSLMQTPLDAGAFTCCPGFTYLTS
jgi:Ferritin-like